MAKSERFINQERTYGAHNYEPLPVVASSAKGAWVEDVDGNRYMDMISAYSALNQGHAHPKIVDALVTQAQRLPLTSRAMYNDQLGSFLEKVTGIAGKEKALPMNTGAEAVETAIKIARKWGEEVKGVEENRGEIITCEGNFHGRTVTIVSFSSEPQYKTGFGPFTPGFENMVPYGNIEALEEAITPNTVGFLVEPIQGEGGVVVPPEGYLKRAKELCEEHNVLFIADEIQTGLGRTGKMFASDHEDVKPDILVLGKALSGGLYPVSVVLADNDVMNVIKPGDHGSTYGGNPLAAAVGSAALDVLIDERLPDNAARMGSYFSEQLKAMRSPHVKDIRGKGLLVGVEIKPESGNARQFAGALLEEGIIAKDTHNTVVRFAPPLNITQPELNWALPKIAKILK